MLDVLWPAVSGGTDKSGVSWQIVPTVLPKMLMDKDSKKTDRVMEALLKMVKLDIRALESAYERR